MSVSRPPADLGPTSRQPLPFRDGDRVVYLLRPRPPGPAFGRVEVAAAERMLHHGLDDWAFGFGRGKRTLGTTRVVAGARTGTVRLSRYLVQNGDDARISATLLHEIAHAVAYARYGRRAMNHGPLWRSVAREVGAEPRATCSSDPVAPPRHVLVCRRCGTRVGLYRRPKHAPGAYRHRGCGGTFWLEAGAAP
ncbi:MAG: SprT-like domain-containing protein [Trueperaceae bacterium]|nr:SprT-like domain-containing protein [Trueperaceae bacterium]